MHNLKPKKYLGQHFLQDLHIATQIVAQLSASPSDDVIEIGPGEGVLTNILFERYPQLKVIEVDGDAVETLQKRFGKDKLEIIHQDVLKWEMEKILDKDTYFIGNLPYNISSPFFFKLLENPDFVKEGVFMIQKEVAERICAKKGNKTYGILSVLLGTYFECSYLFSVPPAVFRPPPKVMSGVLKLKRKTVSPKVQFAMLKKVVKTAFGQRRKTLRNALKSLKLTDFEGKEELLKLRAEQLGVEEFVRICEFVEG